MPGPEAHIGRWKTGSSGPHFATVGPNQQIATFTNPDANAQQIILQKAGTWHGDNSGDPYSRLVLFWPAADGGQPNGKRIGGVAAYTSEINTAAGYFGSNGGEWAERPLVDSNGNQTVFLTTPGQDYAVGIATRNGTAGVSMVVAADISETNERLYRKTTSGSTPQDGVSSTFSTEGQLNIAFIGEYNVQPNVPGTIVITGGVGNRQPTLTASFSDSNETLKNGLSWDHIAGYRYEIWWNGTKQWEQVYTSTSDDKTNRRSQRQIGIQVPFDTTITAWIAHQDRGGLWGSAQSTTFVVQSGATVEKPTAPTGFITNLSNPGSVTAIYRHSGSLNANGVKAQLRTAGLGLIAESAIKSVSIAPNGTLTMTWAETGFGTLPQASDLRITMQARDTNGNWSPVSAATSIVTNAPPNIPTPITPVNNHVSSSRPKLVAMSSDPNGTTPTVYARIMNAGGTVLQTRTMTHVGSGVYEYQTLASDVASYGTFTYDFYSYDGTLYSGGATSAASSSKSPVRTFQYAAVPVVTITAPTSPVSSATPTLVWTAPGQTHYRIRGYLNGVLVHDSGEVAGSTLNYPIPSAAGWIGGERWNNNEIISWVVSAKDASTLWGDSAPRVLTLQYPPITQLTISGSSLGLSNMRGTAYNHISWSQSAYPGFIHYDVFRDDITGLNGAVIPGTRIHLRREINSGTTALDDFDVTSNQWHRYSVVQTIVSNSDIMSSAESTIDLMVSFRGVILHMPFDPFGTALWLPVGTTTYEPEADWQQTHSAVQALSNRTPFDYSSTPNTISWHHVLTLVSSSYGTSEQQLTMLRKLWNYQSANHSPDGRPHIMCFREGRGGEDARIYGRLERVVRRLGDSNTITVEIDFSERHFVLGVVL